MKNKLNKHLTLLFLQIKAAFMALPKIMSGMIVFGAVMVIMAVGLVVAGSDKDDKQGVMVVAVVYPSGEESKEENKYIEQAFDMLGHLDMVKDVCQFSSYYDEAKALKDMKAGEITAVVVLPEKFISSIVNGVNVPARIVFPSSNANTSSVVFREILEAAASDLSSAQAGIYSVDDVIYQYHGDASDIEEAEFKLNLKYVAYALNRESYYETVDVTGGVAATTAQYYTATGMVLFFLLSGITCVGLLKSESKVMGAALKRYRVAPGANHIYKVLGVTMVFWVILGTAYTLLSLSIVRFPKMAAIVSAFGSIKETVVGSDGVNNVIIEYQQQGALNIVAGVGALFIVLMCAFAFAGLVFKMAGKTVSGVILLFLLSVVMMFCSGCFWPVSMLPAIVGQIGSWMPTSYMFDLSSQIIRGVVDMTTVGINAAYALVFLVMAWFMENRV